MTQRREQTRQLIERAGLVAKAGLVELTADDRALIFGGLLAVAHRLRGADGELYRTSGATADDVRSPPPPPPHLQGTMKRGCEMIETAITGGCQCGAVRFVVDGPLGRASLCHCRMCQKAFGGFFGPLVDAPTLRWTRGQRQLFRSSNLVSRGFCKDCGTPLTFEPDDGIMAVAIGALDEPAKAPPLIQLAYDGRLPCVDDLHSLPAEAESVDVTEHATIVSNQHPDHDLATWPLRAT